MRNPPGATGGNLGDDRSVPAAADVDSRIRELVRTFPASPRRHVQDLEGDWLPCWRDYRRIPKGEEILVYVPVSEVSGEWTIVAFCSECWQMERRRDDPP